MSIQRRGSHFVPIWKPDAVSTYVQPSWAPCSGKVKVLVPASRLEQQAPVPGVEHRTPYSNDFHAWLWLNIANNTFPESTCTDCPRVCARARRCVCVCVNPDSKPGVARDSCSRGPEAHRQDSDQRRRLSVGVKSEGGVLLTYLLVQLTASDRQFGVRTVCACDL